MLALPLLSCGKDTAAPAKSATDPSAKGEAPIAGDITLEAVTLEKLQEGIKQHKGKIVVMDVWSTTCLPCMREFPHLVELHKKYAKDGVVCMSLSLDEAEAHEKALKFLKSKGATFPNYRLTEDGFEKLRIPSIPVVFVYDRNGAEAARFNDDDPDNKFEYGDVEKMVQQILKKEKK